jgi:hypothetical protein
MTQFLSLRQVFEKFFDLQDLSKNLFAALCWLSCESCFVSSEAIDYDTVF